jgi:hypothetical protein
VFQIPKKNDKTTQRADEFWQYDIRAAEQAKLAMQNTELNGRNIDVHYSLPKEEERKAKCDRDKNQVCYYLQLLFIH